MHDPLMWPPAIVTPAGGDGEDDDDDDGDGEDEEKPLEDVVKALEEEA